MTAKEIRDKCEQDILELQKVCNHPSSHQAEECWAIGHFTGRSLMICDICEKVLKKSKCDWDFNPKERDDL